MDILYELSLMMSYSAEMALYVQSDADKFNEASTNYWAKRKEIILEVQRLQAVEQKSFWALQQVKGKE